MTTEEEQIHMMKAYWKRYGQRFLIVTILVLGVVAAWNFWQQHQLRLSLQASQTYDQLLRAFDQEDEPARESHAKYLVSHYEKTPYAAMAGLLLAHQAVQAERYDDALQYLHQVMSQAKIPALKQIARNRAARLYLVKKEYTVALKTLESMDDPAYQPVIAAIQGDVYVAQKRFDEARKYYQKAMDLSPLPGGIPLVEMKLNELAADRVLLSEETS